MPLIVRHMCDNALLSGKMLSGLGELARLCAGGEAGGEGGPAPPMLNADVNVGKRLSTRYRQLTVRAACARRWRTRRWMMPA